MHALRPSKSAIPRAFKDHRTRSAQAYRAYLVGIQARLGALPPAATPVLREVGRLAVELEMMGLELEVARSLKRRRDMARLRRQMIPMRTQLITLERRLEELASRNGHGGGPSLAEVLGGPRG